MDYSNIEKLIDVDNYSEMYVDDNNEIQHTNPLLMEPIIPVNRQ